MSKIVITHLISGLGNGGAESMLYQVLKFKSHQEIIYRVISLSDGGYYFEKIKSLGIDVKVINIRICPLIAMVKIISSLKETNVLCCWMYHANFVGLIAGRIAHVNRIVWNIRHSDLSTNLNKKTTLYINKWCAKHSRKVDCIIFNGNKARETHENIGYNCLKSIVLDNGVDINEFKPMKDSRTKLCNELKIDITSKIIFSASRYHPVKDIPSFIKAFKLIHMQMTNSIAIMCGNGIDSSNMELVSLCNSSGLSIGKDIFLLGVRNDLPILFSACDLYILHSAGEAFPNTLIQAMACGTVCLATDVGDVKKILQNDENIVEAGNYNSLAKSAIRLLEKPSDLLMLETNRMINRVHSKYNICMIVKNYERIYLTQNDIKNY